MTPAEALLKQFVEMGRDPGFSCNTTAGTIRMTGLLIEANLLLSRAPQGQECCEVAEAVKWIEGNATRISHRAEDGAKAWGASYRIRLGEWRTRYGSTLPEAVAALKAALAEDNKEAP